MKIWIFLLLLMTGCGDTIFVTGPPGPQGSTGEQGEQGNTGEQGSLGDEGLPGTFLTKIPLPLVNDCVQVGLGLYAQNEGSRVDIAADDLCSSNICDNVDLQEVCWVGNIQFSIQGKNGDMILHKLEFAN